MSRPDEAFVGDGIGIFGGRVRWGGVPGQGSGGRAGVFALFQASGETLLLLNLSLASFFGGQAARRSFGAAIIAIAKGGANIDAGINAHVIG